MWGELWAYEMSILMRATLVYTSIDILVLVPVTKNLEKFWPFAAGFMEISLSVLELWHFEKKCAKNKFLALVKKVHFLAFQIILEKCPTLQGCGVQTA